MSRQHPPKPCPHPDKSAYVNRRRASFALEKLRELAPDKCVGWRIYRCECGCWHLTSKPYRYWESPKLRAVVAGRSRNRRKAPSTPSQPWDRQRNVVELRPVAKPRCRRCRREWVSDLAIDGRSCPVCGGEIVAPKGASGRRAA